MRALGSSGLLPPLVLLLALTACGREEPEAPASTRITTREASVSIETPVDAPDAAVLTFEIQTGRSFASFTVEEEFLARARQRLGINAGIAHTTGVTQDVAGSLKLRLDGDAVTVVGGSFTARLSALRPKLQSKIIFPFSVMNG